MTERKAHFTVTSVLPKCDYREEWKPEELTSEYISAQLQVLDFLDTHAADEITPTQAHFWTENVGTKPKGPTAKQVVELCYFMRSFGFDVYMKANPHNSKIQLFVANRDAKDRKHDFLYWEQDLRSGETAPLSLVGYSSGLQAPNRRGAVGNIWSYAARRSGKE